MIASKFGIGQQVRHKLLGYLGVVIDVDPEYSLEKPSLDEIAADATLRAAPWYHVVMEDDEGKPIHTYLAEVQLNYETSPVHPEVWHSTWRAGFALERGFEGPQWALLLRPLKLCADPTPRHYPSMGSRGNTGRRTRL